LNYTEEPPREIAVSSGSARMKIAPQRGGLVTSFSIDDAEILYLDRATFNDLTQNVRGGIPLLFPHAGPSKSNLYHLSQHGFARRMPWNVIAQDSNSITLQLSSDVETRKDFPFEFELRLKASVAGNTLTHIFTVINKSDKPMPTAYGTHPYFQIPQADKQNLTANIEGFNPKEIDWSGGFDQSFANPGRIRIQMPGKKLTLETDPDIFEVVRIWHLAGKDFVCIEPWTRDSFAIDDPGQCLWVGPREPLSLAIAISAEIGK
jgi:galactose mutarotase-like enzyme